MTPAARLTAIADDLGECLRAVLSASRVLSAGDDYGQLSARLKRDIDQRVQIMTPWTIVDESTVPITIFSAS